MSGKVKTKSAILEKFLVKYIETGFMRNFISGIVYNKDDCDDIVQDVVYRLLKYNFFKTYDYSRNGLDSFVWRTVRNTIILHFKANAKWDKIKYIKSLSKVYDLYDRIDEKMAIPEKYHEIYDLLLSGMTCKAIADIHGKTNAWGCYIRNKILSY